jgi:hypothetical protein
VNSSPSISSLYSSRVEREDPFGLSGFFSSANLAATADEQEEWNWLRHEKDRDRTEDDVLSRSGSSQDYMSQPPTPGGIMFSKEDELAGEEIKGEDKLGVLSLRMYIMLGARWSVLTEVLQKTCFQWAHTPAWMTVYIHRTQTMSPLTTIRCMMLCADVAETTINVLR